MPKKPLAVAGPPAKRRGRGSTQSDGMVDRFWAHGKKQLNQAQIEFGAAIDRYKLERNRPFLTYSEILDVVLLLGYRKTEAESDAKDFPP